MDLHLYNRPGCPFAQRTAIVMREKGLTCGHTPIDAGRKPDWFLALRPDGRIPVLRHEGRLIGESLVILEYLEDAFPDPPLMPASPFDRARARLWMRQCDADVVASFGRLLKARDPDAVEPAHARVVEALDAVDGAIAEGGGPWFLGGGPTLADAALFPFVPRILAVAGLRGRPMALDAWPALHAWWGYAEQRDGWAATGRDAAGWTEIYSRFTPA